MQGVADRFRLSESSTAAELDSLALPEDPDEGPLLITSASPVRPLHNACTAKRVSVASSQAAQQLRLSGSGQGMMTVVRTQFVPLSDSLSDSDSDSEVSVASCLQSIKVPAASFAGTADVCVCDIRRILNLLLVADSLIANIGMHAYMLTTSTLVAHLHLVMHLQ